MLRAACCFAAFCYKDQRRDHWVKGSSLTCAMTKSPQYPMFEFSKIAVSGAISGFLMDKMVAGRLTRVVGLTNESPLQAVKPKHHAPSTDSRRITTP